jgi:hypothetical protein
MYNIVLSGTAGPEPDIAKARVYQDGAKVAEVDAAAGQAFSVTLTHPGDATIQITHSFVDGAGNESAQGPALAVVVPPVPDLTAPAAPTGPMTLVSVVWVP